ncbi:nuclear pore complex protein Nup50 [Galendromus occidentalis]|uniref:Nuclear pore complex protein Nup50 n=1 Tax=Galendromus occidentalis TaxID=34638 RepID=A0AAJ6QXV1_9ACAR|nr:nuclear pore complex protein Nup50 [Galendromus occidentalis]
MAKRRAEKTLTQDDLEEDDTPEEAGEFERASDEVLARRTFRKAKRTLPTTNNASAPRVSPFAGFSFLGNGGPNPPGQSTSMTNSTVSPSNGVKTSDEYLSKVAKLNKDILDCITRLMGNGAYINLTPCFEDYMKHFQRLTEEEEERQRKNNNNGTASNNVLVPTPAGTSIAEPSPTKSQTEAPKQTFSFQTQGASKTTMFGGNATTSLFNFDTTPKSASPENNSKPEFQFAKPVDPGKKFSFGLSSTSGKADGESEDPAASPIPAAKSLPFGAPPTSASTSGNPQTKAPLFSFGLGTTPTSGFQGFGTTGIQAPASASQATANHEDEEDQPPKVEIAPVEVEGSLYSKKVKLYYKKKQPDDKGAFAEKGVGFLHIIALDGGGHQLLVRAQTTLGNILLNIRLNKNMPVSRMKNNNVAIICVPNPPLNPNPKQDDEAPAPTMFLIKVKSKEDAAELHDKLVEFKESA